MTRVIDTIILFVAFVGLVIMIVAPPFGWGILVFVLLAVAFGGDA